MAMNPSASGSSLGRSPGGGSMYEGMLGLDTVYDGAFERQSTASLFGTRGGKYSTHQTYGSAFRSSTPRPWDSKPPRHTLKLGPGDYTPHTLSHSLASGSTSWNSRGRTGPVGFAFDINRKSLPFRSSIPRLTNSTTLHPKPANKTIKEDAFMLSFDARREGCIRREFAKTIHMRALPPLSR